MTNESVEDGPGEEGNRAVTDHKPSTSAFPMFVAFGLAIAEVGVVVGVFVLTVVGFLAFTGALAGMLAESGYVDDGWKTLGAFAVVVFAIGAAIFAAFGGTVGGSELVAVPNDIAYRGLSMVAAGAITFLTAVVGSTRDAFAPQA